MQLREKLKEYSIPKSSINIIMNTSSSSSLAHERSSSSICVQPGHDSGLVLTTDPKPRLRWTVELHERFVDAVKQLGGPDSMT